MYPEFIQLSVADQLREETLSMMTIDGGLSEEEAIAIIDHLQLELMHGNRKIWYMGRAKNKKR
jgi:hypothetical protein